jgi:hypothetical protein
MHCCTRDSVRLEVEKRKHTSASEIMVADGSGSWCLTSAETGKNMHTHSRSASDGSHLPKHGRGSSSDASVASRPASLMHSSCTSMDLSNQSLESSYGKIRGSTREQLKYTEDSDVASALSTCITSYYVRSKAFFSGCISSTVETEIEGVLLSF